MWSIYVNIYYNAWSCGQSFLNTLGLGMESVYKTNKLKRIGNSKYKFVSIGNSSVVLIDMENNLWTFGSNINGELGLDDTNSRKIPTLVPNIKVLYAHCSHNNITVIDINNTAYISGANWYGPPGEPEGFSN